MSSPLLRGRAFQAIALLSRLVLHTAWPNGPGNCSAASLCAAQRQQVNAQCFTYQKGWFPARDAAHSCHHPRVSWQPGPRLGAHSAPQPSSPPSPIVPAPQPAPWPRAQPCSAQPTPQPPAQPAAQPTGLGPGRRARRRAQGVTGGGRNWALRGGPRNWALRGGVRNWALRGGSTAHGM